MLQILSRDIQIIKMAFEYCELGLQGCSLTISNCGERAEFEDRTAVVVHTHNSTIAKSIVAEFTLDEFNCLCEDLEGMDRLKAVQKWIELKSELERIARG